jgi:hypothetical protein
MSDDFKVEVNGLRDLRNALRAVEDATPGALRDGLADLAGLVAEDARNRVPVRTGKARASIVVRRQTAGAAIATGGSRAEYEPWLDFGGRVGRGRSVVRPFLKTGRYVYPALADKRAVINQRLDRLLADLAGQAGFDTTGDARG